MRTVYRPVGDEAMFFDKVTGQLGGTIPLIPCWVPSRHGLEIRTRELGAAHGRNGLIQLIGYWVCHDVGDRASDRSKTATPKVIGFLNSASPAQLYLSRPAAP